MRCEVVGGDIRLGDVRCLKGDSSNTIKPYWNMGGVAKRITKVPAELVAYGS